MDDSNNINFQSGNIQKKDISFNVRERKTTKFFQSIKTFFTHLGHKLANFPPFRGKNKFITLGIVIFVTALAILTPIFLPKIIDALNRPPDPIPITEEERQEDIIDTGTEVGLFDPAQTTDEENTSLLSDLDVKISNSQDLSEKSFYIISKSVILNKVGRTEEAINLLKTSIDELRTAKQWGFLRDTYKFISDYYTGLGDITSAIEWLQGAIGVITEAENDPDRDPSVDGISGREVYTAILQELQAKL